MILPQNHGNIMTIISQVSGTHMRSHDGVTGIKLLNGVLCLSNQKPTIDNTKSFKHNDEDYRIVYLYV